MIWVAAKAKLTPAKTAIKQTFFLEREICIKLFNKLFTETWDKLSANQRKEMLNKIDPNNKIKDKAAIVALSSSGAIAALSTSVAFSGFAFYTTMSVGISTAAGLLGITLPFAAYTGASSVVAFLSGPVGWAIAGIAALGGVALAGRANVTKTSAFISQIHALKVAALIEAGIPEKEIFDT